jgi:hypothetical protein
MLEVNHNKEGEIMKRYFPTGIVSVFILGSIVFASRDVEIQQKKLISKTPPFSIATPSEFKLIHSDSLDVPKENSRTRTYLFIKEKNKQVEEMFLMEIADKTNPQASPMTFPPLKPLAEKRMYQKDRKKKGDLEIDYMVQLIAWNPDAPSLQTIHKRGYRIPRYWALQGQLLFSYLGEHVVLIRYSRDVSTFGMKTSEEGKDWEKHSISGNERKIYETFQRGFMEMVNSISLKNY